MSNAPVDLKNLLKDRNMKLAQLAATLKVNKSLVTRWAQRRVPAERVTEVEAATGIPRTDLRPDLYA